MDDEPRQTAEARRAAEQAPETPPMQGTVLSLYRGRRLASWGARVVAYIVDALFGLALAAPGTVLVVVGAATHGAVRGSLLGIGSVLLLIGVLVQIWQTGWRQGAQGQSWGKVVTGLRTVSADDLRPIGGGRGLLRWLVDTVLGWIAVLQLLNYLWPLWDDRNQTWADKAVRSVVLAK
jgi:uncharacterized RDD family membrane protein YckC